MKKLKFTKTAVAVLLASASLTLVGCGSSNDSDKGVHDPVITQSLSGIVSDPAITGSKVVVFDGQGAETAFTAITDGTGAFTIDGLPEGDLAKYRLVATGGIDKSTGQDFTDIKLSTTLDVFSEKSALVVSPLTSLIDAEIISGTSADEVLALLKIKLADGDLLADPSSNKALQNLSMQLTLLLDNGFSFTNILAALDNEAGISETDLNALFENKKPETKARLIRAFEQLAQSPDKAAQIKAYQLMNIEDVILDVTGLQLSDSGELADNVSTNIIKLSEHFYMLGQVKTEKHITTEEVIASLAHSGSVSSADLEEAEFSPDNFKLIKVAGSDADFSDSLKLAFYTLSNPVTGNSQLVVHDTETNKQQVIKTDIILGNRAFIFNAEKDGEKTVFKSHAYGLFLDPSQAYETRTGQGRYGPYEYKFYLNNVLKAYDVSKPAAERIIFSAESFSEQLKAQGVAVLDKTYRVVDNLLDIDNSYVELKAFEKLADPLKGELPSSLDHAPLAVRLSDGAYTLGHLTALLKNDDGKTSNVLVSYEAVHKKGSYPSGDTDRKRLQLCNTDFTTCDDVTAMNGIGDGGFYFRSENSTHIYLNKHGSDKYFAYNKAELTLHVVTGVTFPATFNKKHHLVGASGHGGSGILNNFSSLPSLTSNLSEDDNAYLAVNYDLDTENEVGSYKYLGKIFTFKNAQVVKFKGTTGVIMFDTGDGIDLGNESDAKEVNGHVNLIAALNGKLFIEIGNYDGSGEDCTPDASGYYCSSVAYGYLNQDSVDKTAFDSEIVRKDKLRYMIARRLPAYAINGDLYINVLHEEGGHGVGHQYTLSRYNTNSVELISQVQGRSYFTLSAKYDDGRMEGQVISWDAATNKLMNVTANKTIVADLASTIEGETAINSVFAQSNGLPLAGLGSVFALRADPGDHQWYLQAGSLKGEGNIDTIDKIAGSSWLYY
ncbi:MAG: carboxypeptidase regulatory-like domain-containing protein [Colwellia sp.]|nr:carboxypeptidase regulatory-like domain-containing protein [Colwellia sp.]